jgi:glycosyltransferase involved in cell wall biosynthesis
MPHPTVSVILPVRNGARFLPEALESIRAQTLREIEILLIDDGSTDRSPEIAREFARRDRRFLVMSQEPRGIASALNTGIQMARGRYVARMDADDVAVPMRIERQVAFLAANPRCVALGSDVEIIDEEGQALGTLASPRRHADIERLLLDVCSNSLIHPSVVMRTDAVRSIGGYRAETYPSEDFDLWLRLSEIGELANLGETLLRYRRHRDAICVRERQRQIVMTSGLVDAARSRKGLSPLPRRLRSADGSSAAATYHFDCARVALKSGKRLAALRHAGASILSEPLWMKPYAAIAACALPTRLVTRLYSRLSAIF